MYILIYSDVLYNLKYVVPVIIGLFTCSDLYISIQSWISQLTASSTKVSLFYE